LTTADDPKLALTVELSSGAHPLTEGFAGFMGSGSLPALSAPVPPAGHSATEYRAGGQDEVRRRPLKAAISRTNLPVKEHM
jgi:hypothetical protein